MVLIIGDWSDAGHTMKYQKSTKSKGWIVLFRRHGIKVYLIDEYRTSSVCPDCDEDIVKDLKKRPSSRPWKRAQGKQETVHGLLGCCNLKCKQKWTYKYWNRDMMSAKNMLRIVERVCETGERPHSLSRKKNSETPPSCRTVAEKD